MAKKKSAGTAPKAAAKKAAVKKVAAKKAPRKKAPPAATGHVPEVRVRMFRHGLGDCFWVTFDVGHDERHMLIDCGTLGEKNTGVTIENIKDEILSVIGDGKLDVLVVTHEHKDHLSGFNGPMSKLKDRVKHVWLAWTEDPEDDDAKAVAKYKNDLGLALAAVANATADTDAGRAVGDVLGFAGEVDSDIFSFAKTIDKAMDFVRTEIGAKVQYWEPGDLIEEEWLPGFRIYILGPPRNSELIKELGSHESDELYNEHSGLHTAALARLALEHELQPLDDAGLPPHSSQFPFDERFNHTDQALFRSLYAEYFDDQQQWRTIDRDWLHMATDLALQLDSLTNNTSLVMAIERIADGKVLLFPADAQLGNWRSWHEDKMKWSISGAGGRKQSVTARDLLKKTVFYKVGHHGSHNATARALGLEIMEQEDELVAFVPVDRQIALSRNPKGSWQMPARPLYRRLLEKCQGRVVRSDLGWANAATAGDAIEKELKDLASKQHWQKWTTNQEAADHVTVTNTYVEFSLK